MTSKTMNTPLYQLGWMFGHTSETALPLFMGYTEKTPRSGEIKEISSLKEFEQWFGTSPRPRFQIKPHPERDYQLSRNSQHQYQLYTALELFFAAQNGPCQVCSLGQYNAAPCVKDFEQALTQTSNTNFSVLLAPDAALLDQEGHQQFERALQQMGKQPSDLVCETVPLYPWPLKKHSSTAIPTAEALTAATTPAAASLGYIENRSTLIELLLWEAGQYLKEEIITERRYAKLRGTIMRLTDPTADTKELQEALLPRSPLLQDILAEMSWALRPFPALS